MIKAIWGITRAPFQHDKVTLLAQQQAIVDMIKIHAQQGGFSVIIGEPGVGKTVLREHLQELDRAREYTVVSCTRTLHTYRQIAWQLAESFKLDTTEKAIENDLILAAFEQVRERKTLYILIDKAHLLEMTVLRKLRLLFERFPKNHNLVLLGQPELLHATRDIIPRNRVPRQSYDTPFAWTSREFAFQSKYDTVSASNKSSFFKVDSDCTHAYGFYH